MAYGHRTGYLADPLADRFVPLPDDLDPLLGVYVAHMGPICANGLLHAAADLHGADVRDLGDGVRGRRVAVVGAGVVALLTGAVRPPPRRRLGGRGRPDPGSAARSPSALGLEALDPDGRRPGRGAQDPLARTAPATAAPTWCSSAGGRPSALHLALRLLRPQGTVIDLAFYQAGADEVRLGEEFHHNGLSLRCAQIGRVPRGLAHAWDRERLSAETIDLLRGVRGRDPQAPGLGGRAVRRGAGRARPTWPPRRRQELQVGADRVTAVHRSRRRGAGYRFRPWVCRSG